MNNLYLMNVTPLYNEELFGAAYNSVDDCRKSKCDALRLKKDKALCVGAYLLLKRALLLAGTDEFSLECKKNEKPFLCGRNDVFFNLSHSGEYVLCAVSDKENGCDIEYIRDINFEIAKRFFFNSEYEAITSAPTPDLCRDLFFRYWTLKESFMKATGLGFKLPLNEFEITFQNDMPSVNQYIDKQSYYFYEFSVLEDYKISLCNSRTNEKPVFKIIDCKDII